MELESTKLQEKSLFTTEDLHHVWLSIGHRGAMIINVTDSVNDLVYEIAEYNNGWYKVKHQNYFNNVFLKNIRKYPHKITGMFKFYNQQKENKNSHELKTISLTFNCFKRRFNIYIHRTLNKTKKLIWE